MSTNSEGPNIEVGQVWRRKKDGALIRVTAYWREFGDVNWRSMDEPFTKKGAVYHWNLRRLYEYVGMAEPVANALVPDERTEK